MGKPKITCNKRCYTSRVIGRKALKAWNKHNKNKMTNVYHCDICDSYHLTSLDKQKSRSFSRYLKNKKDD